MLYSYYLGFLRDTYYVPKDIVDKLCYGLVNSNSVLSIANIGFQYLTSVRRNVDRRHENQ